MPPFFEREGRKGFAEVAKENQMWISIFCGLCVIFAPFAF